MFTKEQIEEANKTLISCPFCGGKAEFFCSKHGQLSIHHYPEMGVNCPARMDQVCDTFDMGREWWNKRKLIL